VIERFVSFSPVRPRVIADDRKPVRRRMHARQIAVLGVAVALTLACDARDRSFSLATATAAAATKQNAHESARAIRAAVTPPGASRLPALASTMDVTVTGDDVHFTMQITNNSSKKLELTFPSGQTHDVVVLDAAGGEVWRWSTGQMFTQALRNQPLDPRASLTYSMRWRAPRAHGALTAVATLTSTNFPLESRAPFSLP
jgi:hypothetical protein